MKKGNAILLIIVFVIIGGLVSILVVQGNKPGKYDTLAQCINESGAKFYGAWWCPHCQAEKALFGKSVKYLPYVECSTQSQKQNKTCDDAQIEGYPTWEITKPIVITSDSAPNMCHALSNTAAAAADPDVCKQAGVPSQFRNVWIFSGWPRVIATEQPVVSGNTWTFPAGTRLSGEVPLEKLAQVTNCTLPQ